MTEVGLRELRQQASELLRRVEAGEEITVTVSGRPAAVLSPARPRAWRRPGDLDVIFASGLRIELEEDGLDHTVQDPWTRR